MMEMDTMKNATFIAVAALLLAAGPLAAQSPGDAEGYDLEAREAEVERRMRDAEARMAEAARQIAELTAERLPQLEKIQRRIEIVNDGRPRLGVSIGGDSDEPVEGVQVLAVTPGSAASDAGLRAGDLITAINAEGLGADDAKLATRKLLDFMQGVEEGDVLDVEYLRDGKVGKVEVEPRPADVRVFAFGGNDPRLLHGTAPGVRIGPGGAHGMAEPFVFNWTSNGWGDMELVELNQGLGRYFGTDSGLLVVRAPQSDAFQLQDGDVIQSIDGREPNSVRHAMRILSSYQAGEQLDIEIMRDKKRRTLEVEMPDHRKSQALPQPAPVIRPTRAAKPLSPAAPLERT